MMFVYAIAGAGDEAATPVPHRSTSSPVPPSMTFVTADSVPASFIARAAD